MKTLSIKLIVIFSLVCVCATGVFAQTNDALAEQSLEAIRSGKFEEGLQICKKILESEPTHPQANYACGAASRFLGNNAEAEKYLVEAEKTIKDKAQLYAFLGAAYYFNREKDKSLADFNTSVNFLTKAIKLNPKFSLSYDFRATIYKRFYGETKIKADSQLKETYFADMRQVVLLEPDYTAYIYKYAETSQRFGEYIEQIWAYAKVLENLNVDPQAVNNPQVTEAVNEICSGADDLLERPRMYQGEKPYPSELADSYSLMKACLKAINKLGNDETRSNRVIRRIPGRLISISQKISEKNKLNYLLDPRYLADVNEVIAGDPDGNFYPYRIDVYLFRKDFVKAEADIDKASSLPIWKTNGNWTVLDIRKAKIEMQKKEYVKASILAKNIVVFNNNYDDAYDSPSRLRFLALFDATLMTAEILVKAPEYFGSETIQKPIPAKERNDTYGSGFRLAERLLAELANDVNYKVDEQYKAVKLLVDKEVAKLPNDIKLLELDMNEEAQVLFEKRIGLFREVVENKKKTESRETTTLDEVRKALAKLDETLALYYKLRRFRLLIKVETATGFEIDDLDAERKRLKFLAGIMGEKID